MTRTGTAADTLTVNYATANGTASAPGDYTAKSGTLSFRSWETAKTVTVATISDGLGEPAETFSLSLSSPSPGGTVGTASATATIAASSAANLPPVANPDSGVTTVCRAVIINVVANDTDPEGNTPLTVTAVGAATLGVTSLVGTTSVRFLAFGGTGRDSFSYTVSDSLGATSTGTVEVTINNGDGCN